MANGRGSLECCYCEFFQCHQPQWLGYDAAYEAGSCSFHNAPLPSTKDTWLHRVCAGFSPNEFFAAQSNLSVNERFKAFPDPLAPGVLYGFAYNNPSGVHPFATLSLPEA
jgi:hypothetical protein